MGGESTVGMVISTKSDGKGVSSGRHSVDGDSGRGGEGDSVDLVGDDGSLLVGDRVMGDEGQETHHRDVVDNHSGSDPEDTQSSGPEDSTPHLESGDDMFSSIVKDRNVPSRLGGDYSDSSIESFSSSVFVETGHESE